MEAIFATLVCAAMIFGFTSCEKSCERRSLEDTKERLEMCSPVCGDHPVVNYSNGVCMCDASRIVKAVEAK
jgi:hypothetical protein